MQSDDFPGRKGFKQAAQAETNARGTQSVKEEKRLLRQQEQAALQWGDAG